MRATTRCGKYRYRDKIDALIALSDAQAAAERGKHRRAEKRAYYCDGCRAWHLTSQMKKAREQMLNRAS